MKYISYLFILFAALSCSSSQTEERKPFMIINRPSEYRLYMTPHLDLGVGSANLNAEELSFKALDQSHYGGDLTFTLANPIHPFYFSLGKYRNNFRKYGGTDGTERIFSLAEDKELLTLGTAFGVKSFNFSVMFLDFKYSPLVKSEFNTFPIEGRNLTNLELDANEFDIRLGLGMNYFVGFLGYRVTNYDIGFKNKYFYLEMSFSPFILQLL